MQAPNEKANEEQNDPNEQQQIVISKETWNQRTSQIKPNKEDMDKLVMNFLVLEGYKEGAIKFQQESGIKADIDHAQIDQRINIRKLITDGRIEEAIK